jgi:hypothetical protein
VREALVENAGDMIDEDRRQCEPAPEIDFVRGSHSGVGYRGMRFGEAQP